MHTGFYEDLGARRLSTLVKESYKFSRPLAASQAAADVRALVLQRLPLFLHDHEHDSPRVSLSAMQTERGFAVQAYGDVGVVKVLKFGNVHVQKTLEASAVASLESRGMFSGQVQLAIAAKTQVDMFECVWCSLCSGERRLIGGAGSRTRCAGCCSRRRRRTTRCCFRRSSQRTCRR
jgi:hypothetical protein